MWAMSPVKRLNAMTRPASLSSDRSGTQRRARVADDALRTPPPDPALSAEARIAEVVGLTAPERHRELATGPPSELAARIVAFLEERGFL